MGSDGLKHVVHRRVHLERHQPKARRKLGYLEKHKDYVKRAKDFHRKEDQIKLLQRKAFFRNEDEFAHSMMSHRHEAGRLRKKEKRRPDDEMRLLDSQDARYIGMREQMDLKGIEKRQQNLHLLDASKNNKHTLFLDDDDLAAAPAVRARSSDSSTKRSAIPKKRKMEDFDIAAHLDTRPDMLSQKSNRLRNKQLETYTPKDSAEIERARKHAYKDLEHRQERAKKLGRVRAELELRQTLRGKGTKRKMKDKGEGGTAAVYKWAAERKK